MAFRGVRQHESGYRTNNALTPLIGTGNYYGATSNNMMLVHWPLMLLCYVLVQLGGDWAGPIAL